MAKNWYIPLDVGAWLKDCACTSMDTQGCLLNVLFRMYELGKPLVCLSFNQLFNLWKKDRENCLKIIAEIIENDLLLVEILPDDTVKFTSRRLKKSEDKSLIYSENGKKGGRPKKQNDNLIESNLKAKEKLSPNYNYNYNSDSNNEIKGKGVRGKTKIIDLIPNDWEAKIFLESWADFVEMRKKKKAPLTDNAIKRLVGNLVALSGGNIDRAIEIVHRSTDKAWTDFYPLDQKQIPKTHQFDRP